MGYSTNFEGKLEFTTELTASQLAKVKSFMGADCREHPEWEVAKKQELTWIDLELCDDFSGIEWNGGEKTYDLVEKINLIINEMNKVYPDFGLKGSMNAQGEDFDDRWILAINEEGYAERRDIVIQGEKVTCPLCDGHFILETDNN